MTYDESNAKITELLAGRTVDCVMRKGKELVIALDNGCEVTLQSDVNGDIHYKRHETRIQLSGVGIGAQIGVL